MHLPARSVLGAHPPSSLFWRVMEQKTVIIVLSQTRILSLSRNEPTSPRQSLHAPLRYCKDNRIVCLRAVQSLRSCRGNHHMQDHTTLVMTESAYVISMTDATFSGSEHQTFVHQAQLFSLSLHTATGQTVVANVVCDVANLRLKDCRLHNIQKS